MAHDTIPFCRCWKSCTRKREPLMTAVANAKPEQVPYIIGVMNPVSGTPFHLIRHASHWLRNPKNYSQDLWSEILATQCQFYINVMLTCALLTQRALSTSCKNCMSVQ
jgi:hypothetical protein